MLAVAAAMMAGIATAHLTNSVEPVPWLVAMALSALLASVIAFLPRAKAFATPTVALLATLFCGFSGGLLQSSVQRDDWRAGCPENAYIELHIDETPQPRRRSLKARASVSAVDGQRRRGDITIFLRPDSMAHNLRYGDMLLIHAYPDSGRHSVYVTSDHYIVTARDNTSLRARCEAMRMALLHRMQDGPLAPEQTAMAAALTLGWRAGIPDSTYADFRDAGVAHLLAVSGLHVGLVAAMVGAVLFWVGRERRGRLVRGSVQLVAVWLFALVTGLAPSTTRAALMFSLFIVSDITGRRTPRLNLLATAAVITLGLKPTLLFDVGWQLSYSAVAGIIVARPLITAFRNRLWQTAAVSLAATMATTPVTIAVFHRFQPYFLIANIIIVPLAGVLLLLSLLYVAFPASATAWPLDIMLRFAESVTAWVASLPYSVIEFTP